MSSDQHEAENHRKRRRNRMRVSCLNCYASKRKCDRKRPCTRCVKHGLTGLCVYELDDPESRDPTLNETTHLRNRIAELESVIRELNNRPHPRWFASNGTEHVPELVSARRSSSNLSGRGSNKTGNADNSQRTRKVSFRGRTSTSSDNVKAGSKRKHEEKTKNASLSLDNASFDAKKPRHAGLNNGNAAGRKTYNSDASYCTDDDDDDDDDYEDEGDEDYFGSRSRFKAASRRFRTPAKRAQNIAAAYSRRNEPKLVHSHPHGTSSSTSISRSISISSSNTPSTPSSPVLFERQIQNNTEEPKVKHLGGGVPAQSALGLILDGAPDSCISPSSIIHGPNQIELLDVEIRDVKNESPDNNGVDDNEVSSPEGSPLAKLYPLRNDVIWCGPNADCDDGSGSSASSKLRIRDTSANSTRTSCQKRRFEKIFKPSKKEHCETSTVGLDQDADAPVQGVENPQSRIASNLKSVTGPCSCLCDTRVCNDVASLITALSNIRDVLTTAHGASESEEERRECEPFKRILELNEYVSALANKVTAPQEDENNNVGGLGVVAVAATDDAAGDGVFSTSNTVQSSIPVPGDRHHLNKPSSTAQSSSNEASNAAESSVEIDAVSVAESKTNNGEATQRYCEEKFRACSTESNSHPTITAAPSVQPDMAIKTPTVPATLLSVPTPASILERSLSHLPSNRLTDSETEIATSSLPSTVTLASILADKLGSPTLQAASVTQMKGPRTPGPTPAISPTPSFSPSSPVLRPANFAMRRPDADLLPLYSYHALSDHHGKTVTTEHVNSIPSLAATSHDDVTTLAEPLNSNNTVAIDVNMDMDLDVDGEGEPAPESGYQYAYFEDGYRYEYVCIDDVYKR